MNRISISTGRVAFETWAGELEWYFQRAICRHAKTDYERAMYVRYNRGDKNRLDSYSVFFGQIVLHGGSLKAGRVERGAELDFCWTPEGRVIPLLRPVRIEGMSNLETHLQLSSFEAVALPDINLNSVSGYARSLLAYQRVTSAKREETFLDVLIVTWMRMRHPREYEGKWERMPWRYWKQVSAAIAGVAALVTILGVVLGWFEA